MIPRLVARFLFFATVLCLSTVPVWAQPGTDTLKEVKITGSRNKWGDTRLSEFSPGQQVVAIDSTALQQYSMQNMANLLTQQLPVFVKTYSFNGLATLNFRGSGAAQSQVLWNGVPIQNAALGIADVSLLPVMFMSGVNIIYGGSSALYGSGNVGGALLLENAAPVFDSGRRTLFVSAGAGSFGQYSGGAEGTASGKKWYLSAKLLGQTAQNNFTYTDGGIKKEMQNSMLRSDAAMLYAALKTGAYGTIGLSAWVQEYNREIPPALFEISGSRKRQLDGSVRLLLNWEKRTKDGTANWYAKSSFISDRIGYEDDPILLRTTSIVHQYFQEAGWSKRWGRYGKLLLFTPWQVSWMKKPVSEATRQQTKLALAGAYDVKMLDNRLDIAVNARAETNALDTQSALSHGGQRFLLPGADASYKVLSWLMIRANLQRSYRAPTLNELYYDPGGNPSLKPEQGWSKDVGYSVKIVRKRCSVQHHLAAFDRNIQDWIIWLGGAIWTPHNIAKVHSRGVETENKATLTIKKWQLHAGINTAYVLATTTSSYIYNDGSIGKQIPYTPRYNGQLNIGFTYKRLYVNYNHTYTGYRFTVSDESDYLLPYNTGNLQAMYSLKAGGHPLQLSAQCNNIWNAQYSVVFSRPMPGINWLIGCRLGIKD